MTKDGDVKPLRLCIVGSAGRLAASIMRAADINGDIVSTAIEAGEEDPDSASEFDIVVDASSPEGTLRASEIALNKGVPLIVCTTGLPKETHNVLKEASAHIPILIAPNTSLGVAVVAGLVKEAAKALPDWRVEIEETHHEKKNDKPSGTARFFAESVASGSGHPVPGDLIHSHRTGEVVGEHTVIFTGSSEVIRIEHRATDRYLFGQGAIRAAHWLAGQSPGSYSIHHILADR